MTNRFIAPHRPIGRPAQLSGATMPTSTAAPTRVWARGMSTTDRALVVLIENGGVDLGIPGLVDAVLRLLPGTGLLPLDSREQLVSAVRRAVVSATDSALETAELVLNRYESARPQHFHDVVVLRDGTASYNDLKGTLFAITRAGKVADVVILTHGRDEYISVPGGIDAGRIRAMRTEFGQPLRIRAVFMMNCVGSSLNQAWLDAGALTSAGSTGNNYLPEPTTYYFWTAWKAGQAFETAATSAYRRTVTLLNDTVSGLVRTIPLPGAGALADAIDVSQLEEIRSSAPLVAGQGSVTITSGYAGPTATSKALPMSLTTTVVPTWALPHSNSGGGRYARPFDVAAIDAPTIVQVASRPAGRRATDLVHSYDPAATAGAIDDAAATVDRLVRVPLAEHERDALTSFAQAITPDRFASSRLLARLNAGSKPDVVAELRQWVKVRRNGAIVESATLVRRRASEIALFDHDSTSGLVLAPALSTYSYTQNPGVIIAGITIADALQIGLGAVAVAQAGIQSVQGGWSLTYPGAERLLTPEARAAMPGSQPSKQTHRRQLFDIGIGRWGTARAIVIIEWEGNPYGEIGTVRMERDLPTSTEWSRSNCSIQLNRLQRIPNAGTDPRTWPIVFSYTGAFDPVGNGQYEFTGEFEIDAFGRLHFVRHHVVSRSFADWMLADPPEVAVQRGANVDAAVPEIPAEQVAYLRTRLT